MNLRNTIEQVVEDVTRSLDSVKTRRALSQVLDPLMPYNWGLGLRVSHSSATQMEIVIPDRQRNLDKEGQLLEAALVAAAGFGYRLFWNQYFSEGAYQLLITNMNLERHHRALGSLRLRFEISEISREAVLAEATHRGKTTHECTMSIFDDLDQIAAKIDLQAQITRPMELEWK